MKAEYINSIINSVLTVVSMTFGKTAEKQNVYVKNNDINSSHLSAIIEAKGDHIGAFVISLSEDDAKKMASALLMEEKDFLDQDVLDAMGEIINIITGRAKAALIEKGLNFILSPPKFVLGKGTYLIKDRSYAPYIGVHFASDVGNFSVEVSLK